MSMKDDIGIGPVRLFILAVIAFICIYVPNMGDDGLKDLEGLVANIFTVE